MEFGDVFPTHGFRRASAPQSWIDRAGKRYVEVRE
jgi:hypothetical protein